MHYHFSNYTELLYEQIKHRLFFQKRSVFAKRLLIVPSSAIKSWLTLALAKDPEVGIAAGLEITYLDQALNSLSEHFSKSKLTKFSVLDISLAIEIEIRDIVNNWKERGDGDHRLWQPLLAYLKIEENHFSAKSARRLVEISETLASLFIQYGIYGEKLVVAWEQDHQSNWQIALWNLVREKYGWQPLCKELNQIEIKNSEELEIHLFSLAFIPHLYHSFFHKISSHCPIYFYLLSPCQAFWSDIYSDYEKNRLLNFWKKQGVSEKERDALEEYLRDRNPLLANFGRLGREMVKSVEEYEVYSDANYQMPSSVKTISQYDEFLFDELSYKNKTVLSLLDAIQADLLTLRDPGVSNPIAIPESDCSIQIHVATDRMREIQILYDNLLGLIDKHSQSDTPLYPSEMIVMAPDIMDYEPYIKAVFGSEESLLDFQIMDLQMIAQGQVAQAFLHLLSLPFSRWDAPSILDLFSFPAFQQSQKFLNEDLDLLRMWIEEVGIRWGQTADHRNELLQRDHCQEKMEEDTEVGTWEQGLSRLAASLALTSLSDKELGINLPILPLDCIETSQAQLIGKFSALLISLREDLKILTDGTTLTLNEWSSHLKHLLEGYFGLDALKNESGLVSQIESLCCSTKFRNKKFSYSSIKKRFEESLKKERLNYRESHLQAVRFCSMLPMRAVPSKAICLIGMDEGVFPKKESQNSLNLLNHAKCDYCPSQTDFDRYLFLETMLSAREYFLISHLSYSMMDGKKQNASILVTELISYLDKAYKLGSCTFSEKLIWIHPAHPFDKVYFNPDSAFKSHSQKHYRSALAYYQLEKERLDCFLPSFSIRSPSKQEGCEVSLNLKQLNAFAKNPIKSYFNHSLGIYLKDSENQIQSDEDFVLSPLDLAKFKKMGLKHSLDFVHKLAKQQGHLPGGLFKTLALAKIENEVELLKNNFKQVEVDIQQIFKIEVSELYSEPFQTMSGDWQLPPLEIDYQEKKVKITGSFDEVSSKGLIAEAKDDKVDVIKVIPQFLVFQALIEKHALPIETQLIFIKNGKKKSPFFEDSKELLKRYLEYYFLSLNNPSPLIPEWVSDFLFKTPEEFKNRMESSLKNSFTPIYNDYLKWISRGIKLSGLRLPETQDTEGHWKDQAEAIYSKMYQEWYPKIKRNSDSDENA
jgi:exodeoxyribonuclease V gamma subunit